MATLEKRNLALADGCNVDIFNQVLQYVYYAIVRSQVLLDAISSGKYTCAKKNIVNSEPLMPTVYNIGDNLSLEYLSKVITGNANINSEDTYTYLKNIISKMNMYQHRVVCMNKSGRLFDFRKENFKDAIIGMINENQFFYSKLFADENGNPTGRFSLYEVLVSFNFY